MGSRSARSRGRLVILGVVVLLGAAGTGIAFAVTGGSPKASGPFVTTAVLQNAELNSVTCWSSASCMAVGTVPGPKANGEGEVWLLSNGKPVASHPVSGAASLVTVACRAPGQCIAGGRTPQSTGQAAGSPVVPGVGATVTISGGVPGPVEKVPGVEAVVGVTCWSAASCVGVGELATGSAVLSFRDGSVSSVDRVPADGTFESISCGAPADCEIASFLNPNNAASTGLLIPLKNGKLGTPVRVGLTLGLWGISCAEASSCLAVGVDRAQLASELRGTFLGVKSGVAGAVSTVASSGELYSVSCVATTCEAVGGQPGDITSVAVLIDNGRVAKVSSATSPQYFDHIDCPTAALCVATGRSGFGSVIDEVKP
jgi:hypothetical protein